MKPVIILLDTAFPYEKVESFLETEIFFYQKRANVLIANCLLQDDTDMRDASDATVLDIPPIKPKPLRLIEKPFWAIRAGSTHIFWDEIRKLKNSKKLSWKVVKCLLVFMADGEKNVSRIYRELKDKNISGNVILYSYWMHIHAYVAARLKEKIAKSSFITRCHRYDLYEEDNEINYLPLRNYIINSANKIFCISEAGKDYLLKKYQIDSSKIEVSRLGTRDFGKGRIPNRNKLEIVSCSWLVQVKRVEKILSAILQIDDIQIKWTHFGGGENYRKLKMETNKLPGNVEINLLGSVSNKEIHKFYKQHGAHIFVNVSESEGVPVSIMEAMSYGIPIIATDVGGVSEIVNDDTNILLNKNFEVNELSQAFREIYFMSDELYFEKRLKTRDIWEKLCSADKIYPEFVEQICDRL